jgi:tetratricopeptide (TPR) repeat protein
VSAAALGRAEAERGNADEARLWARRTAQSADSLDHRGTKMYAFAQLGLIYLALGDFAAARAAMDACLDMSDVAGVDILRSIARAGRGHALVQLGRHEDGLADLQAAVEDLEHRQMRFDALTVRTWLALSFTTAGRPDEALQTIEAVPHAAAQIGAQALEAWAHYALATAQRYAMPIAAAENLTRAAERAGVLDMQPLLRRCRRDTPATPLFALT